MVEKPIYRVPSMTEIAALPHNGFTVASTFSGCGGSSLGYKMAGFRVAYANEFVPAAQETYRANFPGTFLDTRDIRTVKGEEILAACGLGVGELDVLDGSPPCASFSTAGLREKGWGRVKKYSDTEQRTDDLFFEYIRLIREIKPKVFVAENVKGLTIGKAAGMMGTAQFDMFGAHEETFIHKMMDAGYRVEVRVLNAAELGVPQARQRAIFVGVREDLVLEPSHPKPLSYRYSLRDAIPGIEEPSLEGDVEPEAWMTRYATGREWENLRPGDQSEKYFQLVRVDPDIPVGTVTALGGNAGLASVSHPFECRKFSIAELKKICAFPDDFNLVGTYKQKWERLGRSVPPVMMAAIAGNVRDKILIPLRGKQ